MTEIRSSKPVLDFEYLDFEICIGLFSNIGT